MTISIPRSGDVLKPPAVFHLGQPWNPTLEPDFRPAEVRVGWEPAALLVEAVLEDDEVFSQATADNQDMWRLGDVFEVFLQIEGRSDYAEMHLTPNGHRLQLRLPGADWAATLKAQSRTFEELKVFPVAFAGEPAGTGSGWRVSLRIPAVVLGLEAWQAGQRLRANFCRYDAAADREPVLSASSRLSVVSFHRPGEWSRLRLL